MPIGFITTLPSSSPDLIDEFTGTSLVTGSAGIGLTVNNNCTADAGGIDTGIDTANYLEWNTAFIRGSNPLSYDLAGGFTMQWDMLVWPFTDVHGTQNLRAFFSMVGTASAALFRQTTSSSGLQLFENGGFAPAIRTFTDGYESTATDYGKLTTSYDPNRGDFGVIDIWLDYFLIMSVELGAVPDFSTALRLLNNTTTAMGALSRNFQLFRGATVPVATQNVSTVGDSFLGVWGAYQLGGDTNNSGAPILGFQGGDVYGGGENSVIPSNNFKNQSFLARLHKEMALKGIYPSGGIINNYGRGGARAYSASIPPTSTYPDSKTLLERTDALFAPTTSTVIPAPYGGQGTGVVDTLIIQIGTNDIAIAAVEGISLVTSLANLQTQLDSYIDDGVSSIILCNAPPLYTAGPTAPQHVAETTQWNAGVALLNGYGGVVVVVDINTNWLSTYLNSDGVHPNALGQAFWAEQVGAALALPHSVANPIDVIDFSELIAANAIKKVACFYQGNENGGAIAADKFQYGPNLEVGEPSDAWQNTGWMTGSGSSVAQHIGFHSDGTAQQEEYTDNLFKLNNGLMVVAFQIAYSASPASNERMFTLGGQDGAGTSTLRGVDFFTQTTGEVRQSVIKDDGTTKITGTKDATDFDDEMTIVIHNDCRPNGTGKVVYAASKNGDGYSFTTGDATSSLNKYQDADFNDMLGYPTGMTSGVGLFIGARWREASSDWFTGVPFQIRRLLIMNFKDNDPGNIGDIMFELVLNDCIPSAAVLKGIQDA